MSPRSQASHAARTSSTFSRDIAYPRSPGGSPHCLLGALEPLHKSDLLVPEREENAEALLNFTETITWYVSQFLIARR